MLKKYLQSLLIIIPSLAFIAVGLFFLFSTSPLSMINVAQGRQSLTPLGFVETSKALVLRRNYDDLAWMSLAPEQAVFDGDRIFVGTSAQLVIDFGEEEGKVEVQPGSLIQVRFLEGKPCIILSVGGVEAVEETKVGMREAGSTQTKPIPQPTPQAVTKMETKSTPEPPQVQEEIAPKALQHGNATFPADQGFILLTKEASIQIQGPRCSEDCVLRVWENEILKMEQQFKAGDIPKLGLSMFPMSVDVKWEIEDGDKKHLRHFFVREFSVPLFEKAVGEGKAVEVL